MFPYLRSIGVGGLLTFLIGAGGCMAFESPVSPLLRGRKPQAAKKSLETHVISSQPITFSDEPLMKQPMQTCIGQTSLKPEDPPYMRSREVIYPFMGVWIEIRREITDEKMPTDFIAGSSGTWVNPSAEIVYYNTPLIKRLRDERLSALLRDTATVAILGEQYLFDLAEKARAYRRNPAIGDKDAEFLFYQSLAFMLKEHAWIGNHWKRRGKAGTSFFHMYKENPSILTGNFIEKIFKIREMTMLPYIALIRNSGSIPLSMDEEMMMGLVMKERGVSSEAGGKAYAHLFSLGILTVGAGYDSELLMPSIAGESISLNLIAANNTPQQIQMARQMTALIAEHYQGTTYSIGRQQLTIKDCFDGMIKFFLDPEDGKRDALRFVTEKMYGSRIAEGLFGKKG